MRERHQLTIKPWFADHSVSGTPVLPAVETLGFLAARCLERYPELDLATMVEARFQKFLELGGGRDQVAVLVELTIEGNQLRASLLSEVALKAMTRIKEHGTVCFPLGPTGDDTEEVGEIVMPPTGEQHFPAEDIYSHLVPFGPAYRSLHGTLVLDGNHAIGRVRAPLLDGKNPQPDRLGSPFPCDGAMHAACVLGQQRVDFIPFPVGFAKRRILRPTRPGGDYRVKASLIAQSHGELVFAVRIADDSGQLFEAIDGLRMRNVGLVKPQEKLVGESSPPAFPTPSGIP